MKHFPVVKIVSKNILSLSHKISRFICSQNNQNVLAMDYGQWQQQSIITADLKVKKVILDNNLGWAEGNSVDNSGRFIAAKLGRELGVFIVCADNFSEYKVLDCVTAEDCIFDESGRLWVAHKSGSNLVIEVFDSSADRTLLVKQDFAMRKSSLFKFFNHFGSNVFLQATDKTEVKSHLVTIEDSKHLTLKRLGGLNQKRLLAFAEHGEIIGVSEESAGFQKINPPFKKLSKRCLYPVVADPNEWGSMNYNACYLDWFHVLVASSTHRFFVLHTRSMEIIKEIEIEGLPAIEFCKFESPPLFERCGDVVLLLSRKSKPKRPQLVVLSVSELIH